MALAKQNVPLSFGLGIDTKTDPKQVKGKLLSLQNASFQSGLQIKKTNGFSGLPALPSGIGVGMAAFNKEITALDGKSLFSFNQSGNNWVNKGPLVTTQLQTNTIVRNQNGQTVQDSAVLAGLNAFTWLDSTGGVRYSIIDAATGQSIVNNQLVDAGAVKAKVMALGTNFIIVYSVAGTLFYRAIASATPTILGAATVIDAGFSAAHPNFDCALVAGSLAIVYNLAGGTQTALRTLAANLVLSASTVIAASSDEALTTFIDPATTNIWIVMADGTNNLRYTVYTTGFAVVLAVTLIETAAAAIRNITGIIPVSGAAGSTIFYELVGFDTSNNFVKSVAASLTVVGAPAVFIRGVGLGSKAFLGVLNTVSLVVSYNSTLQSTYWLVNGAGVPMLKFSPLLGGGLTGSSVLPEVNNLGNGTFLLAGLVKDLLESVNGTQFTQTGVIAVTMTFSTVAPSKVILASNLHVAGGLLQMYDGGAVVEHGFNVFPENLSGTIINTGGQIGVGILGSAAPSYQYVAVYAWTDNQGNQHFSAPSVPLTQVLTGFVPIVATGNITANSNQVTNVPPALGQQMAIGQFFNILGQGFFLPNSTITAISADFTTLTISSPNNIGTHPGPTTAGVQFTATNAPISITNPESPVSGNISFTAGQKSFQDREGAVANPYRLQVGQVIGFGTWATSNITNPFPAGTIITSVNTVNSGGQFTTTYGTNNPASYTPETQPVSEVAFWSVNTQSVSIQVPTLRLTEKQNVSILLFRTLNFGSLFFQVTSPQAPVANNPNVDFVIIIDGLADNQIQGNQQLYTTGGVFENDAPPAFSIIGTFKNRAIGVLAENPLQWQFSQEVEPGVPVQWSSFFIKNIDSSIRAIKAFGVLDDKAIFFGPDRIFYVVGSGPSPSGLNDDFTDAARIQTDAGCQNQNSIIEAASAHLPGGGGIFFQSQKGIYLLGRDLSVAYVGADVEAFNAIQVTSAKLLEALNQVRFTLANGTTLVYDYFYRQWDTLTGINANDSDFVGTNFTYITPTGVVAQETPGQFVNADASAVLFGFASNWFSFANIQGYQRVYEMLILGLWKSAHTLTIQIFTDFNEAAPVQTTVIPVNQLLNPYQLRVHMNALSAKAQSMKLVVQESQTAPFGEGLSISNFAFIAGVKTGLNKVKASQAYG